MDLDHWNTTRRHTVVIIGGLVAFVLFLVIMSWLGGKKETGSGPVAVKIAPADTSAAPASAQAGPAAASSPASASAGTAVLSAATTAAAREPTPTPVVRKLRSPGGNESIALPPDEDPALTALPAFIPAYPGSRTISCNLGGSTETTPRGSYVFSTPDKPDEVGSYYKDEFTNAGLVVSLNIGGNDRKGTSFTLIADGGAAGRSVSLRVDYIEGRSHGSVGFVGK